MSSDYSRKFVHVCSGVLCLSFPYYIDAEWQITLMAIMFFTLLFISERQKWFKGITAVERETKGSWLFVLSVWVCFMAYLKLGEVSYFILPIGVLTLADTAAFFVGSFFPIKEFSVLSGKKSFGGSLAFFLVSCIVMLVFQKFFPTDSLGLSLCSIIASSVIVTIAEACSSKGWDNLSIPIVTLCCIYICQHIHWIA